MLNKEIIRDLLLTASGIKRTQESSGYLKLLESLLTKGSQQDLNLLLPFLAYKPDSVELTIEARKASLMLSAIHMKQLSWLNTCIEKQIIKNVPVILLKGHGLNGTVYDHRFPRTSSDMDMLVGEEHFEKLSSDFKRDSVVWTTTRKHDRFVFKKPFQIQVELHKRLSETSIFNITYDEIWQSSIEHPYFNNRNIRCLSPEYNLIHAIIHSYCHLNLYPYILLDIITIILAGVDFEEVIEIAGKTGCYHLLVEVMSSLEKCLDPVSLDAFALFRCNSWSYHKLYSFVFSDISTFSRSRWRQLAAGLLPDTVCQKSRAIVEAFKQYHELVKARSKNR